MASLPCPYPYKEQKLFLSCLCLISIWAERSGQGLLLFLDIHECQLLLGERIPFMSYYYTSSQAIRTIPPNTWVTSSQLKYVYNHTLLFSCMYVCTHVCRDVHVKITGQLVVVNFLFLSCGSLGQNLGYQACLQTSLSTDASCWLLEYVFNLYPFLKVKCVSPSREGRNICKAQAYIFSVTKKIDPNELF